MGVVTSTRTSASKAILLQEISSVVATVSQTDWIINQSERQSNPNQISARVRYLIGPADKFARFTRLWI